jgi:hypothetical protein
MVNNSNFWIGNNQFSNDEDTVGADGGGLASVGLNFSGSDWLGVGAVFSSLSKGTAECGAKPTCISTKNNNCSKQKTAYSDCLSRSLNTKTVIQDSKSKSNTTIIVISLVLVAVLITGIYLFKKKK